MFDTDGTKYHPLFEHLLYGGHGQVTMTFAEIESVIDAKLPSSARKRQEWWSNSPNGHSQARSWMRANYKASAVDLVGQKVTFTLNGWPDGYKRVTSLAKIEHSGLSEGAQAGFADGGASTPGPVRDHPLFGAWKGKVTLLPGHDYTRPAFDPEEDLGD